MGVLSTAGTDGSPWGSATYFVSDENFNLFFVTRANTRKYKNITENPLVAFTVADESSQITVQIAGKISAVPPEDYMEVVFNKFDKVRPNNNESWAPPISKIHKGNFMPLQLTPTKLIFADYGKFKLEPDAEYIQNVIG